MKDVTVKAKISKEQVEKIVSDVIAQMRPEGQRLQDENTELKAQNEAFKTYIKRWASESDFGHCVVTPYINDSPLDYPCGRCGQRWPCPTIVAKDFDL